MKRDKMKRFKTIPPPGSQRKPPVQGKAIYAEDIRLLNPLRIERCFVCAADEKIRKGVSSVKRNLPWVDVQTINAAELSRKLCDDAFVLIVDDTASMLLKPQKFRELHPQHCRIVLLSTVQFIGCAPPHEAAERFPHVKKADMVFYVDDENPPSSIMPSAIRCAEDRINIEHHAQEKRFIFLVVDDEPRWFSQFIPVLYNIIGQRADILIARTYEEAESSTREHGDDIVCLISDVNIPREGKNGPHGRELVSFAKKNYPRFPVIIASKCEEAEELSGMGFVLPKGDDGALNELRRYVRDFTGLGDFLFYRDGRFLGRASTLQELRDLIAELPTDVLDLYADKDYFSTWLYMHGFQNLGERLGGRHDQGEELRAILLSFIDDELVDVSVQPFIFLDCDGTEVAVAHTLEQLGDSIRVIDVGTLEFYSHIDGFSTWLMKKGHGKLADRLRPLHASGEDLRTRILKLIDQELGRR